MTGTKRGIIRRRLLWRVLFFSLALTLALTVFQAVLDYRVRLGGIQKDFVHIRQVQSDSIAQALWNFDNRQLESQVSGIVQLPYFCYAGIQDNEDWLVRSGQWGNARYVTYTIPLEHNAEKIGVLVLQADVAEVLRDTFRSMSLLFLFQGLAVTIVALFLLWLMDRMVIRHLSVAADYFKSFELERFGPPLQIAKRDFNDEIDMLVHAFNQMRSNLASAYRRQTSSIEKLNESQKALRLSRQMLARILDAVPMAIFWKNVQGVYQGCNKQFAGEVGLVAPEEIVGKRDADFFTDEEAAAFRRVEQATMRSGQSLHRKEEQRMRADGSIYWVDISIIVLRDEHGRAYSLLGVYEDITERRQADELRLAKETADRANRAKSAFLANMSHEIRTPLNAIIGFSQLLQRDQSILPEQRKKLNTIMRSSEHLLALINNILDLSKIEAGRVAVDESVYDLRALLLDMETIFRFRLEAKGLYFKLEVADSVPQYVKGDENKLRQILINLAGNAIKFTEQGGVVIRANAGGSENGKRLLRLEIEDSGPGISPADIGGLFQNFQQTSTGIRAGGGTGLGLAISRQFARLMGGDIHLKSELGKGSVFICDIPVCVEEESCPLVLKSERRTVVGLEPGQKPVRTLVVDDLVENRELLHEVLAQVGFEVRAAANGAEAVDIFADWQPGLIITDIVMPVMDGYEEIRQIRKLQPERLTRIIAISASTFVETQQEIMQTGADDFIGKPFREDELFAKIARLIPVRYVYADPEDTGALDNGAGRAAGQPGLIKPPHADLAELLDLAKQGDMEGVARYARELEKSGACYKPFADRLLDWTDNFEEKRVRQFLEKCVDDNGGER